MYIERLNALAQAAADNPKVDNQKIKSRIMEDYQKLANYYSEFKARDQYRDAAYAAFDDLQKLAVQLRAFPLFNDKQDKDEQIFAMVKEFFMDEVKNPPKRNDGAKLKTAVRYYSRSGNTKIVAEAMADALGINAVSVDQPEAPITEPVDVLFIGGALYAYGIDRHLKEYIRSLNPANVKNAVVFSTSWISRHSLDLITDALKARGITVRDETFYVKNRASDKQLRQAEGFARMICEKIR
jgi:flavodoxin